MALGLPVQSMQSSHSRQALLPTMPSLRFGGSQKPSVWQIHRQSYPEALAQKHLKDYDLNQFYRLIHHQPLLMRTPHQRLIDMVDRYQLFEKGIGVLRPLYGMAEALEEVYDTLAQSAMGTAMERKMMIFAAGPGSGKSTLAEMIKAGLEKYSQTDEGETYSTKWVDLPESVLDELHQLNLINTGETQYREPMIKHPLLLLPEEGRQLVLDEMEDLRKQGKIKYQYPFSLDEERSRTSQWFIETLKTYYRERPTVLRQLARKPVVTEQALEEFVLKHHARAYPVDFSVQQKTGIGVIDAKKSQFFDPRLITGAPHITREAIKEASHPLVYDYKMGQALVASGGFLEVAEAFKLSPEDLKPFFSILQEKQVRGDGAPPISVRQVVAGHTNIPELDKLFQIKEFDPLMRRIKIIYFKYPTNYLEEARIYRHDFGLHNRRNLKGIEVAPYTYETAALWTVLTRLTLPPEPGADIHSLDDVPKVDDPLEQPDALQAIYRKAQLYSQPQFSFDQPVEFGDVVYDAETLKAWKIAAKNGREGLSGFAPRDMMSYFWPRFLTDKAVTADQTLDGFAVIQALEDWITYHNNEIYTVDLIPKYLKLLTVAQRDLSDHIRPTVQKVRDELKAVSDETVLKHYLRCLNDFRLLTLALRKKADSFTQKPLTSQQQANYRQTLREVSQQMALLEAQAGIAGPDRVAFRRKLYTALKSDLQTVFAPNGRYKVALLPAEILQKLPEALRTAAKPMAEKVNSTLTDRLTDARLADSLPEDRLALSAGNFENAVITESLITGLILASGKGPEKYNDISALRALRACFQLKYATAAS